MKAIPAVMDSALWRAAARRGPTLAALLVALAAPGCVAGGGSGRGLAAPQGTITAQASADWATLLHEGKYRVENNVWNRSRFTGAQAVFLEDLAGEPAFGWQWSWESGRSVAASPEVIYGDKPWSAPAGLETGFPLHPGSADITVRFEASIAARGIYNTAFTLWAVSALPSGRATLSHEIMIWRMQRGLVPAGSRLGTVTVDGAAFDLYVRENHGDPVNPERWTYVAFAPREDLTRPGPGGRLILTGPVRLDPFLDVLVERGILPTSAYVTSVELQNEVAGSAGVTEVRGFEVSVTKR